MLSNNEWDPLKAVVVGTAEGARIPKLDKSLRTVNYADKKNDEDIPSWGLYPKQVINEANEDLEKFCAALRRLGIRVMQPCTYELPEYYYYCPRDIALVCDDKILASPNPIRARAEEYLAIEEHLSKTGKLIVAQCERNDDLYNEKCIGNPNILALTEVEPAFDAANILRDNDNLYYLISNTGNKKGAQYLQNMFPNKKVWPIEGIYSYMHIDSTIALLREGLMLLNPERIKSVDQLPKPLQNWDIIWCPEPVDIGYYQNYCNASTWINMNLFSINPNLVVLEEHQTNLRDELAKHKIECMMLPMRHQRTLGGGFHCVTLDLIRDHT